MKIVVSQPMYFPWVGILEQMRLADIFVHYDDAQNPQGRSFISRVKIASAQETLWLTVPTKKHGKANIDETLIDYSQRWQSKHLNTLSHFYAKAPFRNDAIALMSNVFAHEDKTLANLNIRALEGVADYFSLRAKTIRSSSLSVEGKSSQKLINLVKSMGGEIYITGHGAKNYLAHDLFEENGISVEYMDYKNKVYKQSGDKFVSHMSILDLIAHHGREGIEYLCSGTVHWRKFING